MNGWCPTKEGSLEESECHFDGYCSDCPHQPKTQKEERSMSELDKLEEYLKENGIPYERQDSEDVFDENGLPMSTMFHAIFCPSYEAREWDAICHRGSYGYEDGLLEIYGKIVDPSRAVEGWLTAEDVIGRIRETGQIIKEIES